MIVKDFGGGLNTVLHSSLLKSNQGIVFHNIDTNSRVLKPLGGFVYQASYNIKTYNHYSETLDRVISSDSEIYYANLNDRVYTTDNTFIDASGTHQASIDRPTEPMSLHKIESDTGDYTDYEYCYTYNIDDIESAPSPFVKVTTNLLIQMTVPSKSGYTINIYRRGNALNYFTRIYEGLSNVSNKFDYALDKNVIYNHKLLDINANKMPENLKYLTSHKGQLFGVKGNKVYFSALGYPNLWQAEDYIVVDEQITALATIQYGLLVFSKTDIYIIVGDSTEEYSKFTISKNIGCKSYKSVQYVNNEVWFESHYGIASTNGQQVTLISNHFIKEDLNVTSSSSTKNQYYFLSNGTLYCFDFKNSLYLKTIETSSNSQLLNIQESLYQGNTKYIEGHSANFKFKTGSLYSELTKLKEFKDFSIRAKGEIRLRLYLDEVLIYDKLTQSSKFTTQELKINNVKGYDLVLDISGSGELIEFNVCDKVITRC